MDNVITIIGDLHGDQVRHQRIIDNNDYTLQIGDLGFDYEYMRYVNLHHLFIKGNHDNYDVEVEQDLGDYGYTSLNNVSFFFVRGAFSIDWPWRVSQEQETGNKIWWPQEQLSLEEGEACLKEYIETQPEILISHAVPRRIAEQVGNPAVLKHFGYDPATFTTATQDLLDRMLDAHRPKKMIMGHMHTSYRINDGQTEFIGLDIGETYDLEGI